MVRELKIGEKFRLKQENKDPWGVYAAVTARIIDVKDGWVRYNMGVGSDLVMETAKFLSIYE